MRAIWSVRSVAKVREAGQRQGGRRILLALFLLLVPVAAFAQSVKVTLLQVNDVYEITPVRGKGGLAELSTLLKLERSMNPNTVTVVAGDFLSPSIMSGLTKGAQMIELFNALGVDLVTFGNHEFDFGPDVTQARIKESRFAWLGANVVDQDGKPWGGAVATTTKRVGDVTVGFLGVVTEEARRLSSPGEGITFLPPAEAAKAAVAALRRDGAQVIVALTHLDIADDRALARAVPGIDVILGGHDHDPLTWYEGGTLIHKAGSDAHYLAAIDLDIRATEREGRRNVAVTSQWRMWANVDVKPDPEIAAVVKKYTDRLDQEIGQVIGRTTTELDSRAATVRSGEARIGNLIADAIRERLGTDVAVTNGGGIRANRVLAANSEIARKDVLADLPFGNLAVVVEIAGADLREALEVGLSQVENRAGRFPQVSGLRIEYDPAAAPGQRITRIAVGEAALDPTRRYRLATSDYMARGGDGYAALTKGKIVTDPRYAVLMATMVMDYIVAKGTVAPQLEGRVVAKR
jgi:2',3'-cyclic-nucleotide 2'-phosphodiesterase (5'-nucleotidase family)